MTQAELGRGLGLKDTINLFGIENCPNSCTLKGSGNGQFRCVRYNGNAVVDVYGGVTRSTLNEFSSQAPCMKEPK